MKLALGGRSAALWSALVVALYSAACGETTYEVISAANITINGPTADLEPGQAVQLTAQVVDSEGRSLSGRVISWATSADAVAAVDATGRVTGRTPGSVTITASSEGQSAQRSFTVRSGSPVITSLSPLVTVPNAAFDLTVQGSGFYSGSVVRWNGANRPTTFVSASELRAAIAASDAAVQGPVAITVVNAPPGGGTSNESSLTVRAPNPCEYLVPMAVGSSVSGTLEATDCVLLDASYADIFEVAVVTAQALTFRMTSSEVDPFLMLRDARGDRFLAFNDDVTGLDSDLTVLAPVGRYRLYANTVDPNDVGAYSVTSAPGPAAVSACSKVWIMPGVETTQDLTQTDCTTPVGSEFWYSEQYSMYLTAGQSVTLRMSSTQLDAYLLLLDGETLEELSVDDDSAGNGDAEITFVAPADGVYIVEASTFSPGETGAFTLIVR